MLETKEVTTRTAEAATSLLAKASLTQAFSLQVISA